MRSLNNASRIKSAVDAERNEDLISATSLCCNIQRRAGPNIFRLEHAARLKGHARNDTIPLVKNTIISRSEELAFLDASRQRWT